MFIFIIFIISRWFCAIESISDGLISSPMGIIFVNQDISLYDSLDPCTHAISFDYVFLPATLYILAKIFNRSNTTRFYVSWQTPEKLINKYGFNFVFQKHTVTNTMVGSQSSKTCYFYKKFNKRNLSFSKDDSNLSVDTQTIQTHADQSISEDYNINYLSSEIEKKFTSFARLVKP